MILRECMYGLKPVPFKLTPCRGIRQVGNRASRGRCAKPAHGAPERARSPAN